MFKRKKCKNCGKKINSSYSFCPYCRAPIRNSNGFFEEDENFGLLGKDDRMSFEEMSLPSGFDSLFKFLMKNLNKQFKEFENIEKTPKKSGIKKSGIGISIYTSGNNPPEIKITPFGENVKFSKEKEIKKTLPLKLPSASPSKFSNLPKEEPKTSIRRFSDKIVYEIEMPGVKSIKDVAIFQLENSIEIKALAKNKIFYKIIKVSLPIKKYDLMKEKLLLELDARD